MADDRLAVPLQECTLAALEQALPHTATACVDAIVAEVPGYDRAFDARLRRNIEGAVQQALTTFVEGQAAGGHTTGRGATLDGARELGQGEAASGRTSDALLTAYRVGARVAWQEFSTLALTNGEDAATLARLAAETFVFIDELSAASLAGHTEALTRRTQELARRRDHLAAALATGESRTVLERLASTAHWSTPVNLTALVLDGEPPATLTLHLGAETLWVPAGPGPSVALIPDLAYRDRSRVLHAAQGTGCALGPRVPWDEVAESVHRAQRILHLATGSVPVDVEDHLVDLVLDSDAQSAGRLAERALRPLNELSESKQEVLRETLLTWLLLLGRREDVANALHVHPQTVRYRMAQLRDLYGERLTTTEGVRDLVVGLLAARLTEAGVA